MEEGNSIADGPAEDVVKLFEACSDMASIYVHDYPRRSLVGKITACVGWLSLKRYARG